MYYRQDHMTMNTLLLLKLIFAGFQIQDNLAFGPEPDQYCWSGNKCLQDEHCGNQGQCIGVKVYRTMPPTFDPGLEFINKISYQF